MGFPTIEQAYLDDKTGNFAYLMVTPSGSRVEFRQVGATNVYETADSSYVQLVTPYGSNPNDPVENLTLYVTGTDGTQMTYVWKGGAFRCSEIKDRNGNYITIVHNDFGQLTQMTDTLGRIVTVRYDAYGQPSTVKQMWGSGTNGSGSLTSEHTWATLTYANTTVTTDIDGSLTVVGPPNTTSLRVLDKITYADQSATKFYYNSYAQVYKVENLVPNSDSLNYVRMDSLQYPNANQFDCPKFTDRRTWAKDFNNNAEVVTYNTLTPSQSYSPPIGSTETLTKIDVSTYGHPNNYLSRTFVAESGWREGMPIATEDWTEGTGGWTKQRWTWAEFTQDNTSVAYPVNPRVIQSRVGDSTNTKKTAIEYCAAMPCSGVALYGLATKVEVGSLSTVWKTVETDYNLSTTYTNKRIIGLPSEVRTFGKNDLTNNPEPATRVSYVYDGEAFDQETNQQPALSSATHDNGNYGPSFVLGRGNLTSVTRHDVTGQTASVTSKTRYDTAGSVVAQLDPLNRKVRIEYADVFSDLVNRNSFAYPTKVYDPANNFSEVKYRYDIGANVWAKSPAPHLQSQGKITEREYDDKGRLIKDKIVNHGGAYTRYEYPTNGIQSKVYSTIIDTNTNGTADTTDEVLSESWTDGGGRVIKSRTPHTFNPDGTTATWAATLTEYDIIGQVKRQSVPTEVNSSWAATGVDDGVRGFIWNSREYDWKGRVTRTIPSDSNGTDGKDQLIAYEGCGCAGGLITTIKGPITHAVDVAGNLQTTKRRTQKIYEDIIGRTFKTEQWDLDGAGSAPYSTVGTKFNGRDQAVKITQYAGGDTSTTFQDTTAAFDGHGRLISSHKPEQHDGSTLKYTTYSYNADDSIQTVTDARGAVTTYTYENTGGTPKRPLVTGVGWTVPGGSGIVDPTDVTFTYDNLGNRTAMTDGLGSVAYAYNELSRMTAETRTFTDTLPDKPSGNYNIGYEYTLGGQLKSYTDPWGKQIAYAQDRTGRLTTVTGTSFGGVTTYANNPAYRAWGGLKHLEFGSGMQMNATYDNRLQAASYLLNKISDPSVKTYDKTYQYHSDGLLKLTDDSASTYSDRFDRLFTYDHQGRVKDAKSGLEATTTQTETDLTKLPYRQNYAYNAFGNLTNRNSTLWNYTSGDWDFSYTMANNRVAGFSYDFDGRTTSGDNAAFNYDAAGTMIKTGQTDVYETLIGKDGDGRQAKRSQKTWNTQTSQWNATETLYFIHSSVLGQTVTESTGTGKKMNTYVIAAGAVVAKQNLTGTTEEVSWKHTDPSGLSSTFSIVPGGSGATAFRVEELDGLGNNVGSFAAITIPFIDMPLSQNESILFSRMDRGDCGTIDGMYAPCSMVNALRRTGQGVERNAPAQSVAGIYSYTQQRFVGIAIWDPNAAAAGVGVSSRGLHGLSNYGANTGWVWAGQTFSTQGGVGGVIVGGNWYSLGDYGYSAGSALGSGTTIRGDGYWDFSLGDSKPWYTFGFDGPQEKIIQDQVKSMYSNSACAKAFEDAGLKSVKTMMDSGSLIFVREGTVKNESVSKWMGDDYLRSKMIEQFDSSLLVSAMAIPGGYNGNYYVGVRNRMFTGGDDTPINIIIHELIHSGSVNGSGGGSKDPILLRVQEIENWRTGRVTRRIEHTRTPAHDLDWMNYKDGKYTGVYDGIIKACQPK